MTVAKHSITKGYRGTVGGRECQVLRVIGAATLFVQFIDTDEKSEIKLSELEPQGTGTALPAPLASDTLTEKQRAEATRRLEIIKPLLACEKGRTKVADELAKRHGVTRATIYNWVRRYAARGLLSDLAPRRAGRKTRKRLDPSVERIIQASIEEFYLTKQKPSIKKTIDDIAEKCDARRLTAPHRNTVYARIKELSAHKKAKRREGDKAARYKYEEIKGKFPGADYPLAVVQVDHTKLDIEIIDERSLRSIGRPWLTLAIDVFSRAIVGRLISLDSPSAHSVGLCLANAILPKAAELHRLGITGEWPMQGMMQTIHADNGAEFHSKSLKSACEEYGINLEWRPLSQPHFGGHVERLMRTIADEIHSLPGTTFSNIKQKGEYDSDKTASLTLRKLDLYLTKWMVEVYNRREHSVLGMSPYEKWEEGVVGTPGRPGIGIPTAVEDQERLRTAFLPSEERTVQRDGIVWDKIYYYADILRPWINAQEGRQSKKFVVRRDPRDISKIYFLDPETKQYYPIPYRDARHPGASIWDIRDANKLLKSRKDPEPNEYKIFRALDELRQIKGEAVAETRRERRRQQRDKEHQRIRGDGTYPPHSTSTPTAPSHLRVVGTPAPVNDDELIDLPDISELPPVEDWN